VEFSRELRASVLSGDITVSFRLWKRPQVKPGGRYRVGDGQIEVESVELIPFAFIDEADLRRSGETDGNHCDDGLPMLGRSMLKLSCIGSSFMSLGSQMSGVSSGDRETFRWAILRRWSV